MLLWMGIALAASPTPDRPSVSRSGSLVADDTLELELGAMWGAVRTVPTTLKYSIDGVVEPRLSANLDGIANGSPMMQAGAKIRLMEKRGDALALWAGSTVPVHGGEPWLGEIHMLFSTDLAGDLGFGLNAGLDFAGDGGGVTFAGVPLIGLVSLTPGSRFSVFAELAGRAGVPGCRDLGCLYSQITLDGGVYLSITEILTLDGGVGWSLPTQQPYGTLGLTANLGRLE
ncbi:MAG TPA: hypothetical protein ENK18_21810 [Deltaproteobacteria bacterium]|nr:hypothetical protein [Deltaproteobacteria bacterium]